MRRPCYNCGETEAIIGSGMCADCSLQVHDKAYQSPLVPHCKKCGYAYKIDWERVKHELIGSHNYRAWEPPR